MAQTQEISNTQPAAAHSFADWLRAKADEAERTAAVCAGSSLYPPSWWQRVAADHRQMADDIDRIEGVAS
ncbi:hypothetical protein HNR47_000582 [Methylopila jiangsuensis]|nr:hypothetical protein [Methylopila jiangsuensis]MDR6284599.1 hypothetical protein [Methylopila jiangsuensis]